ncbi:MAG TPA: glycosyl hydrolase, partial [Candidatus Sulfotelmatobacter sp.]|nr:glycosyl hydrolase [Candidatus Sulfotelmatobacter sp.]
REGVMDLQKKTDLSAQVHNGKLSWQAPPGRWRVLAITESRLFEGTHAALNYADHIPYPNLLQPEPIARFLELTHQRYAQHLGDNLGRYFISTFTDEPSLMSLFLRPMPYRVLPWSPDFAAAFQRRNGCSIEALLPALVAEAGPAGQKARYDYWHAVGELVSESYFGQIQQWCAAHQVRSGGHLLMEESLVGLVPLYGDFFRCLRRLDAPSIDCLTSLPDQVPWFIARLASSAAELENKTVTMCETSDHSQRYRPSGDQRPIRIVSEEEIRGTCNRLRVGGIDTITSYYSFDRLGNEQLRRLNEWVGRCCAALQGGYQVADLAVLYPTESVWPRFTPARHYANDAPAAVQIENILRDVSDTLFAAGRDFTFVDSRALAEAKVEQGVLVHGNLRWRVVILPGADTLPWKTWQKLSQFVRSGGVLIAVGARPTNSETEFPSAAVQNLAREILGTPADQLGVCCNPAGGAGIFLPPGSAGLLPLVVKGILEPDVQVGAARSPLRCTHRRIEGHDLYFLINDSAQPWTGSIGLLGTGQGERFDPATGQITPLAATNTFPASLAAYGATLFRFPAARPPSRRDITADVLPNLVWRKLPEVAPQIARGEFVRDQYNTNTSQSMQGAQDSQPAWNVTATLTKSRVDTFLFTRFAYSQPLDLQSADALVLDTWVPEGQHTGSQLLVILHEKDGADYYASTGRSLGRPGHSQTCVPLTPFQLAGWSTDANNQLDLSTITEIRVGWGGYYGAEREQVEFGLAPLRTATAR